MKITPKQEPLMKAAALAEYLDVHRATVYRLAQTGKIPFITIGNTMRFNLEKVLEALENNQSDLSVRPAGRPSH